MRGTLERMGEESRETERRCREAAQSLDGVEGVDQKASETKSEAVEMMQTYLGDDADGLDGLEFLIMAEAGELGHVEIVGKLAEKAEAQPVSALVEWALPVQQRHFETTREAALKLAAQEDPNETE